MQTNIVFPACACLSVCALSSQSERAKMLLHLDGMRGYMQAEGGAFPVETEADDDDDDDYWFRLKSSILSSFQ